MKASIERDSRGFDGHINQTHSLSLPFPRVRFRAKETAHVLPFELLDLQLDSKY